MSEIPEAAVQAVAELMLRRYESQYSAEHLTWRDFADDARADLETAAEAIAAGGATVETEWGVRYRADDLERLDTWSGDEAGARRAVARHRSGGTLVRRIVTYGEWEEATGV